VLCCVCTSARDRSPPHRARARGQHPVIIQIIASCSRLTSVTQLGKSNAAKSLVHLPLSYDICAACPRALTHLQFRLMIVTSVKSCHKHAGLFTSLRSARAVHSLFISPAQLLQTPPARCCSRRRDLHGSQRSHPSAPVAIWSCKPAAAAPNVSARPRIISASGSACPCLNFHSWAVPIS
jgi:hypothetical protein